LYPWVKLTSGKNTLFLILFILVVLVIPTRYASSQQEKEDWPMFRHDPTHTGASESKGLDINYLIWSYETGESIYGSPAVVDGRVYFASYDGHLYCLNAEIGDLIWQYQVKGHIFSSPAVVSGRVYVGISGYMYNGSILCLNAETGNMIWSYETTGWMNVSPTVVEDKVYIGGLFCLDAKTGNLLWSRVNIPEGSPAVIEGKVIIGQSRLFCLDASSGQTIWSCDIGADFGSPVAYKGKVFVGSAKGLFCLDIETGNRIWSYENSGFTDPALYNDRVYVCSWNIGRYYLLCFDYISGSMIWNSSSMVGGPGICYPTVVDGKMYIGANDGWLYCFDAETGDIIWIDKTSAMKKYPSGYSRALGFSSPAIVDDRLYIGSSDHYLYCFGGPFISLHVDPIFFDNLDNPLIPKPSLLTIKCANGSLINVSSEVTLNMLQGGTYSIIKVVWKDIEVLTFPGAEIDLKHNDSWKPHVRCLLPSIMLLSLQSSTSQIGFKVEIKGNLTSNEKGIPDSKVLLLCSVTDGNTWNEITQTTTNIDGSYSAIWMPSATGSYLINAIWRGNEVFPASSALSALAVLPYGDQSVFFSLLKFKNIFIILQQLK
jgi:outer membrane protein assembly factor BamB